MIFAFPTPGGQNYSAGWTGAVQRARDGGAAAVFTVLGFPGNHANHGGGSPASDKVTFSLGMDDAITIREMIEAKQSPVVHVTLSVENRENLTTDSVWGVLPGQTDENILIMAHTEAPMQGAMDNAVRRRYPDRARRVLREHAPRAATAYDHLPNDVCSPYAGSRRGHPVGSGQHG